MPFPRKIGLGLTLLLTLLLVSFAVPAQTETGREPLKIEGKDTLPLRVLSRPFSSVYQDPNDSSARIQDHVPAFQSFYVYDRRGSVSDIDPRGWYEVGVDTRGTVLGWMHSDDVFEWKQTMCLSYTHPEGRYPVLMFDRKEDLEKLTSMPDQERLDEAGQLYIDIAMGDIPEDFPIVTIEPKRAIDISREFYLLPILEFEAIELNNREARILKLAAVTGEGGDARESSDIRTNPDYLSSAVRTSGEIDAATLERLAVDIVWVMDTTNSMMPYVTQTLKVVEEASARISANTDLARAVRFGYWAYRDSLDIPGIEYLVKNFTPELEEIGPFADTLKTVDVATVGSQGYPEDVFSGVASALDKTAWTPDAIRFIILVGDAPSHPVGHRWNASGHSQSTLRAIANDRNVTIHAIHIKDPEAARYHALTEEQFRALSTNRGVEGGPNYYTTSSEDLAGFEGITKSLTDSVLGFLETIAEEKNRALVAASPETATDTTQALQPQAPTRPINLDLLETPPAPVADATEPSAQALADAAMKAAFVQWVGAQTRAQAPRDVVAWVTDKDLLATDIQSLEVRLLITKQQLDSLRETLRTILVAGRTGQISGEDFFSSLQAASAATARDPDMIRQAGSLAETGLIPEFLDGLPYTSRIMDMNDELWNSWSIDEQDMFLADLDARIMAYETIHDGPEGWIQLNKSDDPSEFVYPITLELLP
ncbi:vWA domain-containing protein [Desulfobulbus alkaliphilus]|uniref:vWA domain-containing protein n=1 Tax=Desulfobulbus alkaliphilus TaxID=869814 RepID=UPI0019647452|nr:vWA domain-containing protein [Desulfobulbus alkaliphilus]MBM9536204.1 VWA domain-containing protein [Desulfobulbus alkaliphilus]